MYLTEVGISGIAMDQPGNRQRIGSSELNARMSKRKPRGFTAGSIHAVSPSYSPLAVDRESDDRSSNLRRAVDTEPLPASSSQLANRVTSRARRNARNEQSLGRGRSSLQIVEPQSVMIFIDDELIARESVTKGGITSEKWDGPGSVNDPKLGTINGKCKTCHKYVGGCNGHTGHISLNSPYSPQDFQRTAVKVANSICISCRKPLLTQNDLLRAGILRRREDDPNRYVLVQQGMSRLRLIEKASERKSCSAIRITETGPRTNIVDGEVVDLVTGTIYRIDSGYFIDNLGHDQYLGEEESIIDVGQIIDLENDRTYDVMRGRFINRVDGESNGHTIINIGNAEVYRHGQVCNRPHIKFAYDQKVSRIKYIGNPNNPKDKTEIHLLQLLDIFDDISESDAQLLGFSAPSHPRSLIMTNLSVPPICVRPPRKINGEDKPDKLTAQLRKIVGLNNAIQPPDELSDESNELNIRQLINFDQDKRSNAINKLHEEISQLLSSKGDRYVSVVQLIQGKKGLLRGKAVAKRGDFTGRTVLSPGPELEFGQIGIPRDMASVLTYPVMVTEANKSGLELLIQKGRVSRIRYGGENGEEVWIEPGDQPKRSLEQGDIVERHLQDGDFVAFSRNPVLHKFGIMGYEVVLHDDWTFKINILSTGPHNADFDGDEGNVYLPRTPEAVAELKTIMNSR